MQVEKELAIGILRFYKRISVVNDILDGDE